MSDGFTGAADPLDDGQDSQETAEENLIKDLLEQMEHPVKGMVPIPDDIPVRVARLALDRFVRLHPPFQKKVFIMPWGDAWVFQVVG